MDPRWISYTTPILTPRRFRPNVPRTSPQQMILTAMPSSALDVDARDRLRAELEGLEGVLRAVIDEEPLRVWLVCERTEGPTEMLVRSILARNGLFAADAEVNVS